MSFFMRECDSGIWFKEEDPYDEAYDPSCCRNVYLDLAIGKFDYIDYSQIYINDEGYYSKISKYINYLEKIIKDDDYYADNEEY